jgi:hypothetical protein
MRKKLFLIIVCILFPVIVEGSDWMIIEGIENGEYIDYYFVDNSNIKRPSKTLVRYWYLLKSVNRGHPPLTKDDLKSGAGYRDYIEMDCEKKRTRPVKKELELLDEDKYIEKFKEWHYIEPDSVDEKIYELLCQKGNE